MTQQHVLYGIKVVEREREIERERDRDRDRDRDTDGLWRPVQDPAIQAVLQLKLTRGPFKITDHCANDLGRRQLLASSGGIKDALFHYTVIKKRLQSSVRCK